MHRNRVLGLCVPLLMAGAAGADVAPPGPVTFPIQQGSFLTLILGSRIAGAPLSPQGNDVLAGNYLGNVLATDAEGAISFPGGSTLAAQADPKPHSPAPGGGVGSAPAGYGTTLAVTLGSGQVAIRDLVFDVSGQSPLSGDTGPYYLFRAEPLTFTIASGTLDYRLQSSLFGTRSGSRSLVGLPVDVSGSGNLYAYPATNVGLVQMLTLNLDLSVTLSLEADQDTHLTFDGTVLTDFATTVPDPATVPSLLLAAMAVVTRRPRRKPS